MNVEKLRKLREERDLSQTQVAIDLALSQVRYNCYETGRRTPDNETLKQIATYYNVSVGYLLDAPSPDENIIDLSGLSEEGKQIMLTQLKTVKQLEEAKRNNEAPKKLSPKSALP